MDYDDEDGSNGIIIDKESYGKFRESDLKGINKLSILFFCCYIIYFCI